MEIDNSLDFLPVRYYLTNANGETVNLISFELMGYGITGLGVDFSNSYSQYDNYFSLTKSKVNQGQIGMNILFGDIETETYRTFSDFANFLSYQPLTITYESPSGNWLRDARVSSVSKSEVGGSNNSMDRLNESFSLFFINPWYNNKTSEYVNYSTDVGLTTFGRGYFNETFNSISSYGYFYGNTKKN